MKAKYCGKAGCQQSKEELLQSVRGGRYGPPLVRLKQIRDKRVWKLICTMISRRDTSNYISCPYAIEPPCIDWYAR